jgi:serine carboxypeptidase 1
MHPTTTAKITIVALLLCSLVALAHRRERKEREDFTEQWGYSNVRTDAYMFWWLYSKPNITNRPLIIWLQGGPGASSTGFGNFNELGPVDVEQHARNTTWLNRADLLFIDNPVGTGFSYVNNGAYTTNIDEIAADLLNWAKSWFKTHPTYQRAPLFIFSESYGGKMAAAFAQVLQQAIKKGTVKANLKGVALGDSWISPIDYVNTWGQYLYAFSLIGKQSLTELQTQAQICQDYVTQQQWHDATSCWSAMESVVEQNTDNVNFYNVLEREGGDGWQQVTSHKIRQYLKHVKHHRSNDPLDDLMNGAVREKLGIIPANVTWGGQSQGVFTAQWNDFMKPVIDIVDDLLNKGEIQVIVYNGQLDLICDSIGTEQWVSRLQWADLPAFDASRHLAIRRTDAPSQTALFYKNYKTLTFYWIMRAGHMAPSDSPNAMDILLQRVLAT